MTPPSAQKGVADGVELEVSGLVRRYSPEVMVGPLSFTVASGEFFSLLGPSGCGKTTTLRCIAGFETLDAGAIRLNGERLDAKPPHRRDVGLVFQNYALFPHLSVFDNIAFAVITESMPNSCVTLMPFFSSNFGASTNEARSPSPQLAPVEDTVKLSSARAGRDSPNSASAIAAAPHPRAA